MSTSSSCTGDTEQTPAKKPRMSESGDIADYIKKTSTDITDAIKHQLVDDHFIPDPIYAFPRSSNVHCFQHQWLHRYPWLVYSKQENGGFCLPCVFFLEVATFDQILEYLYNVHSPTLPRHWNC